jgi:serine/threonine-protein kinase
MVGRSLGPYRITGKLGAGGMGEVYRGHDTRLGRDVALKILPPLLAADPERRARFEREARLLAALNHPNIGGIHGLEESDGVTACVLELVDGETLGDRLARGALPIAEAVTLARQIADALAAAHEQGVIHRDLKPANVMITRTGRVKVLDFGLAKTVAPTAASAPRADAASTVMTSLGATEPGMILGTAAYMAPEQARGLSVDGRADVWAFGCVLYEMLTGTEAFPGRDLTEVLARVIERDPDWSRLPPNLPAPIRLLLTHCLAKAPDRRLRAIEDVRILLDGDVAGTAAPPAPAVTRRLTLARAAPAAIAALVVAGLGWLIGRGSAPATLPAAPVHALIDLRPAAVLRGVSAVERTTYGRNVPSRRAIAISPDGSRLAFTARQGDRQALFLRPLDRDEAVEVKGATNADAPFFSPDGRFVGYWSGGALWRVSIDGGLPVKIADTPHVSSVSWTDPSRVVFGTRFAISSVDPGDGGVERLTSLSPDGDEVAHMSPHVLPGGRWLMYTVLPGDFGWQQARVVAQAIGTAERKVVVEGATDARYLPTGHLLYMRLGNLMAAPFDPERAAVTGSEVGVIEGVLQSVNRGAINIDTGAGQYAVSATGTLAYVAGRLMPDYEGVLTWMSRDGREAVVPVPPPARPFFAPRLSPDGRHVAVSTFGLDDHSIFRYDLTSTTLTRLTFSGWATLPVWTADGARLAINFAETGARNLFVLPSTGGAVERLASAPVIQAPAAWAPDGRSLVFMQGGNVFVWSADSDPKTRPLLNAKFSERHADLSPDGRWLAYVSDETGRPEVYVSAFPGMTNKRPASARGGVEPAWSRDGRTLAFLEPRTAEAGGFRVMTIDVTPGGTLSLGAPRHLFDVPWYTGGVIARAYDVTADGQRFLFLREVHPPADAELDHIHVVTNWFDELKRLSEDRTAR